MTHTNHETREEGVDPTHDQCLRDHHHHISLQHSHHCFHARRVSHRVRGRLSTVVGVLQEGATAEARNQVVPSHLERFAVEDGRGVVAEVDATEKGMTLTRFAEGGRWFRRGVHQDSRIVAQDSGQDLLAERS